MAVDKSSTQVDFNQPAAIKNYIKSLSTEQIEALRLSYTYRASQAWLKNTGWINLFLGGLTVWLGVDVPGNPSLKVIQTLLGVALVIVSLWSILSPQPIGIIIWAGVLGVGGAWNIFTFIYQQSLLGGVLGILQLWWAYNLYRTFKKNNQITQYNADSLRMFDNLQGSIRKLKYIDEGSDRAFIRLKLNQRYWQGFLLEDRVILAPQRGISLLISERGKTKFTFSDGKGILRSYIKGTFNLNEISTNKVIFPRFTLKHYNHWVGISDEQTADWLNTFDRNTKKRLPFRIIAILVMAAPIVFLLFWAVFAIITVAIYR